MEDSEKLIPEVIKGDPLYIAGLLKAIPVLKIHALNLSHHDRPFAEDLVQTTILRAMEAENQFRKDPGKTYQASLNEWLKTILHNNFLSEIRKARRTLSLDGNIDRIPEASRQETIEASRQETIMELLEVFERIEKLSYINREALLSSIDGERNVVLARRLGIPEPTVGSRIFRARALLSAALNNPQERTEVSPIP